MSEARGPEDDLRESFRDSGCPLPAQSSAADAEPLTAWCRTAPEEVLRASMEELWFDFYAAGALAEGLRERPELALSLGSEAWRRGNPAIRWTALKILECHPAAAGRLGTFAATETGPWRHHLEASRAMAEGRMKDYLALRARYYGFLERLFGFLDSPKKSERQAAIHSLRHSSDPFFSARLAAALAREPDPRLFKGLLKAVVATQGFLAVPVLLERLGGDLTRPILETLAPLGERHALAFVLAQFGTGRLNLWQQACLAPYRTLAWPLLRQRLHQLDDWRPHRAGLILLLAVWRDDRLHQAFFAEAKRHPGFAAKLAAFLPALLPKCPRRKPLPGLERLRLPAATPLGGRVLEVPGMNRARLAPDGQSLVFARYNRQLERLEWDSGRTEPLLPLPPHSPLVHLEASLDGQWWLIVFRRPGGKPLYSVQVWEYGRWKEPLGEVRLAVAPETLAVTRDRRWLLIGGYQQVPVFSCQTWLQEGELSGHQGGVRFLQSLPDGRLLSGDWSGRLQVWAPPDWTLQRQIQADSWAPRFARLSADGRQLLYAGHIGLRCWDTRDWRETIVQSRSLNNSFMAQSPDERLLVLTVHKKLRFLRHQDGDWREILSLEGTAPATDPPQFTADGQTLLTFNRGDLRRWSMAGLDFCQEPGQGAGDSGHAGIHSALRLG